MNDISGILLVLVLLTTQAKGSRGHKLSQTGSDEAAECRKKTNFVNVVHISAQFCHLYSNSYSEKQQFFDVLGQSRPMAGKA